MDLTDKVCVERCRDGHPEEFGLLVERYRKAVWPAEPSAYLVKCHQNAPLKKWNLALRRDNAAKRRRADGGL